MATLYFHSFLVARLYVVVGVYSPRVVRKVVGGGGCVIFCSKFMFIPHLDLAYPRNRRLSARLCRDFIVQGSMITLVF